MQTKGTLTYPAFLLVVAPLKALRDQEVFQHMRTICEDERLSPKRNDSRSNRTEAQAPTAPSIALIRVARVGDSDLPVVGAPIRLIAASDIERRQRWGTAMRRS